MGASENTVLSELRTETDRIVDAAVALGELRSWNAVHLYDIAEHMGIPLAEIERHFRNKDEIADAWFRRADNAIAACASEPRWMSLTIRERLSRAIRAWFAALEPHKDVAKEMLAYKVQPDHIHLVVKGVIRTSATVQWVREAARVPATGLKRELEEPVLTAIFLGALASWLTEKTPGTPRTWKWMERQLAWADRVARAWPAKAA